MDSGDSFRTSQDFLRTVKGLQGPKHSKAFTGSKKLKEFLEALRGSKVSQAFVRFLNGS